MSSRSGIQASEKVLLDFNLSDCHVLVVTLSEDSTTLVHDPHFQAPTQKDTDSILKGLKTYLEGCFPEPRFAIFNNERLDRIFVSFVPDEAHVRAKMLFASTKNTFLQQLGSAVARNHTLTFTELSDLEPSAFKTAVSLQDSSVSLTAKERSLQAMDSLQNLTLSQRQELPSMGTTSSSLFFQIDPKLDVALKSDLSSKLLIMTIDIENETLQLLADQSNVSVSDLIDVAQRLVSLEPSPAYLLYGYGPSKLAFIYSCASGCKVKARMLYAANKQGLLSHLKNDYFTNGELDQILEVGDLDELELSVLKPEDHSKEPPRGSEMKFSKPKGPRRR